MKTLNLLLGAVLIAGVGAYAWAVNRVEPRQGVTVIIVDPTDSIRVTVDVKQLVTWDADYPILIRVREIGEDDPGRVYTLNLNPVNLPFQPATWDLNSNETVQRFERQRQMAELDSLLNKLYHRPRSSRTSFLRPFISELQAVQGQDDVQVYVIGDLNEHDGELSFIDAHTLAAIERDDPTVWASIPGTSELTNLSGITVTFCHRPPNLQGNQRYRIVSRYLERRLTALHATVQFQGDLIGL